MENQKIIESIVHGGELYLETLAIPSHIEKYSDEMCSWIKPKEGVNNGPVGVYKINFEGKTDDQIRQIFNQYQEKGIPDYWFITPLSVPRHLREIIKSLEQNVSPNYGMAIPPEQMHHADWLELKRNSKVPVKKVSSKEDFYTWTEIVNEVCFGSKLIDPDYYYPVCESGKMICFLGYIDDKPVGTSMTLMNENKIGRLEWVSTLPEYRKKGIGTAVCCAGIEQLINDGACIITAEEGDSSLHTRLGFKVYY